MISLFKKEIRGFFSSVTGVLVIIVFISLNSAFMWIFKGSNNVFENGFASLDSLFSLAPWAFLFLVPAITMRMFAEERKSGTLDLLFTRPLNEWQIIFAKFLASWTLVVLSLLPTLIYFFSVYQLGNPKGNIDVGGTWGSYIGLIFLGGIYTSVGIFCSSLTENQIVAFVLAVLLSFSLYIGLNLVSTVFSNGEIALFFEKAGIDYHYQSISRGVIDSRDLVYFLSVVFLLLFSTRFVILSRKW